MKCKCCGNEITNNHKENCDLTLSIVKRLIKDKEKTEITRFKGEYYILHICKNNVPVPMFHSKSLEEIKNYMENLNE